MFLKSVELKHFCGFSDFKLELGELTVLVGENNSGKTTLLRAIHSAIQATSDIAQGRTNRNLRATLQQQHDMRERALHQPMNLAGQSATQAAQEKPQRWQLPADQIALDDNLKRVGLFRTSSIFFDESISSTGMVDLTFEDGTHVMRSQIVYSANQSIRADFSRDNVPIVELGTVDEVLKCCELFGSVASSWIPGVPAILPPENIAGHQEMTSKINSGNIFDVWRNVLDWLCEGEDPNNLSRVVNRIAEYFPGIRVRPPRRERSGRLVEIIYSENQIDHEIAIAGSGMRGMVFLLAFVELAKNGLLLLDEPDSHLHPTIQRGLADLLADSACRHRQIVMTTHSPDTIEALPDENIRWIDRREQSAKHVDNRRRMLFNLGAVNRLSTPLRQGQAGYLFVEARSDYRALRVLFERCGLEAFLPRVQIETGEGFGAIEKLPDAQSVFKILRIELLKVAAIRDGDFTSTSHDYRIERKNDVLIAYLPCKEIENLLLLSPGSISSACKEKAVAGSDTPDVFPTSEVIGSKIDELTLDSVILKETYNQWLPAYARDNNLNMNDTAQFSQCQKAFDKQWPDAEWRRRYCPGDSVLKKVRTWLQNDFKLNSITTVFFFKHYDPPNELREMLSSVAKHFG